MSSQCKNYLLDVSDFDVTVAGCWGNTEFGFGGTLPVLSSEKVYKNSLTMIREKE